MRSVKMKRKTKKYIMFKNSFKLFFCFVFQISASMGINKEYFNNSLTRVAYIEIIPYDPFQTDYKTEDSEEAFSETKNDNNDNKGLKRVIDSVNTAEKDSEIKEIKASNEQTISNTSFVCLNESTEIDLSCLVQNKNSIFSRKVVYEDQFGYNKNFIYQELKFENFCLDINLQHSQSIKFRPETHEDYLVQLVDYKNKNFDIDSNDIAGESRSHPRSRTKNLLLVRMVLKDCKKTVNDITQSIADAEYVFGVFVSGGKEKTESYQVTEKDKENILNQCREKTTKIGKFSPLENMLVSSQNYKNNKLYYINLFEVRPGVKLLPYNGSNSKGKLREIIENRLFNEDKFQSKTLEENLQATNNRNDFCLKMFGQPAYFKLNNTFCRVCFGEDLNTCFDQSEQSWLNFLTETIEEIDLSKGNDYFCPIKPLFLEDSETYMHTKYDVENIDINLYSCLDICRYCRGTMSYMLVNKNLKKIIQEFFERGCEEFSLNSLKLFAYSNVETKIT